MLKTRCIKDAVSASNALASFGILYGYLIVASDNNVMSNSSQKMFIPENWHAERIKLYVKSE